MVSSTSDEFQTLHEIVKRARIRLPQDRWDYLTGGTETETTLRRNRHALDTWGFKPRVCRDVNEIDTTSSLFGQKLSLPLLLAPIGSLESFDPGGGATSAKASGEFGVAHMLSSRCNPGLEEVAAAADNARIFQLYVRGDASFEDDHVKRAVDNGYCAFAITIDTAVYSRRERDNANRFVKSWRTSATGTQYQALYTWDNVKRFKDTHDIPLILKGIGTAEDAGIAVEHGVNGVYVSNHGGRQLDHGRGSIGVLPEVVKEVGGKATVIVDGAINRGTDIVKAIALGADAVGVGRMQGYGLAADGQAGLVRTLELLQEETMLAMGLLGVSSLAELGPHCLERVESMNPPHVLSAFPHIDVLNQLY